MSRSGSVQLSVDTASFSAITPTELVSMQHYIVNSYHQFNKWRKIRNWHWKTTLNLVSCIIIFWDLVQRINQQTRSYFVAPKDELEITQCTVSQTIANHGVTSEYYPSQRMLKHICWCIISYQKPILNPQLSVVQCVIIRTIFVPNHEYQLLEFVYAYRCRILGAIVENAH